MLPLNWLLSDKKNFVNFVGILGAASSNQIYDTELIGTLVGEFWNENYKKILYRALIPWAFFAITVLYFFSYALAPVDEEGEDEDKRTVGIIVGIIALMLLAYQLFIEIRQFRRLESKLSYFARPVNLIDLYQFTSSVYIIVVNMLQIKVPDVQTQRVMAAFTTLAIWIKVLDWFKLF